MEMKVIKNLSNEEYHHGEAYKEYISSSQLRNYLISPYDYKKKLEEPNETTPAMQLGSTIHDAMEYIHNTGDFSLTDWEKSKAVFEPPINPKTEQPYGASTAKYAEAYKEFLEANTDKEIVSKETLNICHSLSRSVENNDILSRIIMKGDAEASHFIKYEDVGFKIRPDLETSNQIWDWKSFGDKFSKDKILKRIVDSGYDIQAAMYQWQIHEETGIWKPFYMVFMQTIEPYEVCIVSLNNLAYSVHEGLMINDITHGAKQFEILRDLHIHCTEKQTWDGPEIFIEPDRKGRRILEFFKIPSYVTNNIVEPYYT